MDSNLALDYSQCTGKAHLWGFKGPSNKLILPVFIVGMHSEKGTKRFGPISGHQMDPSSKEQLNGLESFSLGTLNSQQLKSINVREDHFTPPIPLSCT